VEKALTCGSTVQPYVVVVGDIDGQDSTYYYTIINNTQYRLETAVKAIDLCFKLYHVLNLEYPPKAEQIWYFFVNTKPPPKKKNFICSKFVQGLTILTTYHSINSIVF